MLINRPFATVDSLEGMPKLTCRHIDVEILMIVSEFAGKISYTIRELRFLILTMMKLLGSVQFVAALMMTTINKSAVLHAGC
jgi:hypothetical protein